MVLSNKEGWFLYSCDYRDDFSQICLENLSVAHSDCLKRVVLVLGISAETSVHKNSNTFCLCATEATLLCLIRSTDDIRVIGGWRYFLVHFDMDVRCTLRMCSVCQCTEIKGKQHYKTEYVPFRQHGQPFRC